MTGKGIQAPLDTTTASFSSDPAPFKDSSLPNANLTYCLKSLVAAGTGRDPSTRAGIGDAGV